MRVRRRDIIVFALSTGLLWSPAFAADERQAETLRNARKYDEAIGAYQKLLAAKTLPREQKARYHWAIFDCLRQQKKNAQALVTLDEILTILPEDDPGSRPALDARFEVLNQLGRREEAAAYATQRSIAATDDPEYAFTWHWRAGTAWNGIKRYADAAAVWTRMRELARKTGDARRLAESLWRLSDEYWAAGQIEQCLEPLSQLVTLTADASSSQLIANGKNRLAECYVKLKRPADARQAYQAFIAAEPTANARQRWWMLLARNWQGEKNIPATLEAAENTFIAQAAMPGYERWFEAQSLIADTLPQGGDPDAVMQAAIVCFDAADSRDRIMQSAGRIGALLRQGDKKAERYKAFLAFQTTGQAPDPLASVVRSVSPARAKAFADADAKLGTDADSLLQRGLMRAYLGQKKEACALLAEACRRAAGEDVASAYATFLLVGVRGVHGNVANLTEVARFLASGASADGGADPIAALQLPPVKLDIPPARLAALQELRARLEMIIADMQWPEAGRRDAVLALQRIHSTLGDWAEPQVLSWYSARAIVEKDPYALELLTQGLLAAARGGELHWGKVRERLSQNPALLPKVQKFLDPAAKSPKSPFFAMQKLEEQSRPETLIRK